jgi:hypothetical protein
MNNAERFKLLHGLYKAPSHRRGDRAVCLYRDCEVVVTTWTDARISWPRCRRRGQKGGSGLLVNEELLRAIRTESAEAIKHWFGVSTHAVWRWRKAFGITQWGTEGSRRLHTQVSEAGAARQRGRRLPLAQVERRRQTAKDLNLGQYLKPGYHGPRWTAATLALLGTLPDDELATRIGRTPEAVRIKRTQLGIPNARDRRRRECKS